MKKLKTISLFLVLIMIFSACSNQANGDAQPNGNSSDKVNESISDSSQDSDSVIINSGEPEEFKPVIYEYEKTSISCEDIKDFLISFSANFILTKDGSVYSWGLNEEGSLGLSLPTDALVLTPVKVDIGEPIEKLLVSRGGNTIIALSKAKNVYCWGCNTMGQLPNIDEIYISSPQKLELEVDIEHIAISDTHLTISDEGGNIYECGDTNNRNDFLYISDESGALPKILSLQSVGQLDNITEISTSFSGSAFLTDSGKVYFLGAVASERFEYYKEPTLIDFSEKIVKVRAIGDGIVALSENGLLYYMGFDLYGIEDSRTETCDETYYSLGINTRSEPTLIAKLGQRVDDFDTSSFSIIVKTENEGFYTWGYNIGHVDAETDDSTVFNPTPLELPDNTKRLIMGPFSGAAITEENEIFAWGTGYYGIYMGDTHIQSHAPTKLVFE